MVLGQIVLGFTNWGNKNMKFNITNKTKKPKTLYDFISDNPELVDNYNNTLGTSTFPKHLVVTIEELLDQALCELPYSNIILQPGENIVEFVNNIIGLEYVLWNQLQTPGKSKIYEWETVN